MVARLRIKASGVKRSDRAPVNVALVVDTSGSMRGKAIDNARKAALAMVDSLAKGDRLAVVVFHSRAQVLVKSTPLDGDTRAGVKDQIQRMKARGTTDLANGLALGLQQVKNHRKANAINRVVLLSDGVPNDPRPMRNLALDAQRHSIPITAMGLGLDYDETLLASLAKTSGGRFHYIEDPTMVAGVFENEVLRLKTVVARGLALTVQPGPGVQILGLVGHPAYRAGRGFGLNLGDLSEGETRDVIARLQVKPRREGSIVEVLDVGLAFTDAVVGAGRLNREDFLSATGTTDAAKIRDHVDASVRASAARARAASATVQAIRMARGGQPKQGVALLVKSEVQARKDAATFKDKELGELADEMAKLKQALPTMVRSPSVHPSNRPKFDAADPGAAPRTIRRVHSKAMKSLR